MPFKTLGGNQSLEIICPLGVNQKERLLLLLLMTATFGDIIYYEKKMM